MRSATDVTNADISLETAPLAVAGASMVAAGVEEAAGGPVVRYGTIFLASRADIT